MEILCVLLTLYTLVLLGRVIASWFPPFESGLLREVVSVFYSLTEPVLAPLRSVIPAAGMIDLSAFVLFVILGILRNSVCSA